MWIKICGITSLEDGRIAAAARADAVGFVFAESPHRVTPETVRKITDNLPAHIEKIGVFVNADIGSVLHTIKRAGLTGVQLHGEDPSGIADSLREQGQKICSAFRVVNVLHYAGDPDRFLAQLRILTNDGGTKTILVDTGIAGRQGGTGIPFDWKAAEPGFRNAAAKSQLIAAGGLNTENVELAIQILQPWGVDVSSGVEFAPGRKQAERVSMFVRVARAAALSLNQVNASTQR